MNRPCQINRIDDIQLVDLSTQVLLVASQVLPSMQDIEASE